MNLRARVRRLEVQALRRRLSIYDDEPLEEDWLLIYEAWAKEDMFASEPDFPLALTTYRQALAEARVGQPSLDPPPDFQPQQPPRQRIVVWRRQHFYAALDKAWLWLSEFFERVTQGIPSVTQADFQDLEDWFRINQEHLTTLEVSSELLQVSGGRSISLTNLRYNLSRGYQARGVGRLAEDIRHLRNRYG
jgi:hypothetical protein